MTDTTIPVVVPDSIDTSPHEIETVLNELVTDDISVKTHEHTEPSVDWSFDSPCPHCGSDDIHVVRGREERYHTSGDGSGLSYDGLATGTVVVQTEAITAFCNDCDETLYEHPTNALLRTDTL